MALAERPYRVGDLVRVKMLEGPPVYCLPSGLPAGATVKVVRRDVGYTDVEFQGTVFHVAMPLIDNGTIAIDDSRLRGFSAIKAALKRNR